LIKLIIYLGGGIKQNS